MTRCDYDGIFYRVFCVTLLAIAFTFTVILTNVFIDIDGILAGKDKEKLEETTAQPQEIDRNVLVYQPEEKIEKKPEYYELKTDKEEDESNYRTKRSIGNKEPTHYQLHLNNPKMKEILNSRLASLLEELDAEETHTTKLDKLKEEDPPKPTQGAVHKKANVNKEGKLKAEKSEDEVMHLAMHNILLQGIIGHMNLNEVYKKVHQLLGTMEGKDARNNRHSEREKKEKHHNKAKTQKPTEEQSQEMTEIPHNLYNIEAKFFEELVKCEQLQKEISGAAEHLSNTRRAGSLHSMEIAGKAEKTANGPKVLIKTIIDIKTLKNQSNSKTLFNSNNIKGLIKLIYNGQPINFTRLDDYEDKKNNYELTEVIPETRDNLKQDVDNILQDDNGNIVNGFLDKALAQYLKKYPTLEHKFKKKRLKRNVKVRPFNQNTKHKKNEDEELYVEIETHFDSKGIKGEKKKKMIKNLIEKIQKAIHANIDTLQEAGKKDKKLNATLIKKRLQNPLEAKEKELNNQIIIPINNIVHRESHPLSKVIKISESVPKIYDQSGENWKQAYHGSNFLSSAKSINSGEMGRVDLDYSNVLKSTGIPQRLQQPLNTDNMEEFVDSGNYFNLGDLKFFVKEIDGTGFSIGFNQYVGEAPDPDSIKIFTGLQQLVQTYNHNNNDMDNKNGVENRNDPENIERNISAEVNHEMRKREVNRMKGPATILFDDENSDADYHSNEYKLVFDENVLPYDSYSEIFEDRNKKISLSIEKDKQSTPTGQDDSNIQSEESLPLMIDENLFEKELKPSEIFGLASLLERKKRSPVVVVKKYSNLNTRTKSRMNRFINTNRMSQRIVKNRRSKRQIDKIRIIATDLPRVSRNSDENVFVVSDETMFADRAVVRDPDVPEQEMDQQEEGSEFVIPHNLYDHAPTPYKQLNSHFNPYNIFSARSRHNSLMSKYPHVFLDEMSHSKEEDSPLFYNKLMKSYTDSRKNFQPTSPPFFVTPRQIPTPMKGNLVSDLSDIHSPKTNYKLTVKIMPKNNTDVHSGFKEIHTSINKSINRNGLVYSSLVNVTELSKVENLNKANQGGENNVVNRPIIIHKPINQVIKDSSIVTERPEQATVTSYIPLVKHIREQQEKMKVLLRQHKKRIDEQLDTLKLEKQNIESIIPNDKKADIEVMLPLNPPQMLHLNKAEAEQLISNALMKLHDAPHLNDISLTNSIPSNVTPEVMPSTTPVTPLPQSTIEPDKLRILRTIQRNENLTNTILYKIDHNTNILQTFLQKLTDRFEPVTSKQEHLPQVPKISNENLWKSPIHAPFFTHTMPNLQVQRNATHVSIPFVYAYQQPNPLPSKSHLPVASVVYQGHIHTNAFNANLKSKENTKKLTDKREANHTRFFLDDLDDFTALPVKPSSARKAYEIPRIKTNITAEIKNL